MTHRPVNVMVVMGTRPEAIKLAPVIRALLERPDRMACRVCVTGQHRDMLDQMLEFFRIPVDEDLNLMKDDQGLADLAARALTSVTASFARLRPEWVIVQGDTTTAMAVSLAAFYSHIRIAHVEAGLRTGNRHAPFPEEVNRRITALVADLHFSPTAGARAALLGEGCSPSTVHVTGNTVIDALYWALDRVRGGHVRLPEELNAFVGDRRLVLVTAHRRENFDEGLREICHAVRTLARRFPDVAFVYPVHPNPNVRRPVSTELAGVQGVLLVPPLGYGEFVSMLDRAHLVLTDSGGVQEEATALGKPMFVMRDATERPEAISAGKAQLTGSRTESIVRTVSSVLMSASRHADMAVPSTAFGDGLAAERIASTLWERACRYQDQPRA